MTKKEIATMVAETINGLEAGMAMVGEKDGQPSVIIGKESVRPSFNVTDDIANHVNACKNEDVYVALAEVAADMRAQYNAASKANPVTRENILKTAKVCLRRTGSSIVWCRRNHKQTCREAHQSDAWGNKPRADSVVCPRNTGFASVHVVR